MLILEVHHSFALLIVSNGGGEIPYKDKPGRRYKLLEVRVSRDKTRMGFLLE